jgi:predicted dehydrogenase
LVELDRSHAIMSVMRALVLGCGSIGARHARNLAALNVDVVVSDPDTDRANAVALDVGGAVAASRNDAQVDVTIIATPTIQHPTDTEWSLDRGYHVFIEKPLAATRIDLARVVAAAATVDRVTMVACNLRFSEGYQSLRANLSRVGKIVSIIADFGWYLPAWRPLEDYTAAYSARRELGGGVILDAAIHELDYVMDLAGPVTAVAGLWTASESLGIGVDDAAEIQLRHEGGCISQIHVDYLRRSYTRSCTVVGSEGTLVWNIAEGRLTVTTETNKIALAIDMLDRDRNAMYMEEMQYFLNTIASGRPVINSVAQAAATTAVALDVLERGRP